MTTTVTADTSDAALALLAGAAATAAVKAVRTHTTLWPSKPLTCDCGRTFRTRKGISRHLKATSNAVSSTWEPEYRRTLANFTATRDALAAAKTERGVHEQQEPDDTEDRCRVPGCDVSLDDGEGWDGMRGTHADQADTSTPTPGHSIYIERQHSADLWVGPYPTTAAAEHALEHALLIDGLCQDDCLDARVVDQGAAPADAAAVLVDLDDPDHTGATRPPSDDDQEIAAALRVMGAPEPSVRGCSCSNADYVAPGHDGGPEAPAPADPGTSPPTTVEALAATVEPREGSWLVERLHGQVSEIAFSDGHRARTLRIYWQGYPGTVYVTTRSGRGFESSTPTLDEAEAIAGFHDLI